MSHPRKSLKGITWQEFVASKVTEIDTWPYLPSGILKKHEEYDHTKTTDDILKFNEEDWKEAVRFAELFSEKQKTVLGWIFTASIAVLGNLAVNLAFAFPTLAGNLFWAVLVLIVVIALTVLYLRFLPKVFAVFRFIPKYVSFPKGYEQHITQAPCTDPYSEIIFAFGTLDELVVNFGALVRTALLKDWLCSSLKNATYIRISNIREIAKDMPVYLIEISTNGAKPWLDPRGREKIRTELRNVVEAMFQARMMCSVRQFELDYNEWNIHGCDFIDGVSKWKFEDVNTAIINRLKSISNKGRAL